MTDVLRKRTGEAMLGRDSESWAARLKQGTGGNQKLAEAGRVLSRVSLPCPHSDSRFLASKTVRGWIFL